MFAQRASPLFASRYIYTLPKSPPFSARPKWFSTAAATTTTTAPRTTEAIDTAKPHLPSPQQVKRLASLPFSDFSALLRTKLSLDEGDGKSLEEIYPALTAGTNQGSKARIAAVLLLCFEMNNQTHILCIKRANVGRHASQIGLPGGKKEESDPTYLQTAIRETHEEIGVNDAEHQLQVVGNMRPFVSNQYKFTVVPFVGTMQHTNSYTVQTSEVDYILEIPLSALAEHYTPFSEYRDTNNTIWKGPTFNISNKNIFVGNGTPTVVEDGDVIWGLTARILAHFFHVLSR